MDERKQALVVGIDAYGHGVPVLSSAVRDANAVAERLGGEHGYAVELLTDATATAAAVSGFLTGAITDGLTEDSSFVFYYAGHGEAADDANGTGPQGFLLLQDAELSRQETWLPMESLRLALEGLSCRHLLLVLDCCYAGTIQWTSTRDIGFVKQQLYRSQYDRYRAGLAWHVLTSAAYDERADDAPPFTQDRGEGAGADGHSPFAWSLLEGLSGKADYARAGSEPDGVITAMELYQYIREDVAVNGRQTPGIFPLKRENKGEFVFRSPGVALKLQPDPPLDEANNPWRGLQGYSAADQDLLFGRSAALEELTARVEASRFVAVVGASGSGKSSLVQAGLLPTLRAVGWTVVDSTPPQLAEAQAQLAAAPPGARRLLAIDGFEELYLRGETDARAALVDRLRELIAADGGPTVLVTLRSDVESQAAGELADLWASARYPVPPFSAEDLREVVVGPAAAKAVFFEPAELADRLVDAVSGMPGALPLLSLTLAELYRQAQTRRLETGTADRMLSADDYDAIGGVAGVVYRRAGALLAEGGEARESSIRRILLRLVAQETDGLKRRRVFREELEFEVDDDGAESRLLAHWVDGSLLVVGGDGGREYVEPAHDALVVTWDRQQQWLTLSGSQKVVRDAWSAADDWERKDGKRKASKYLWNHNPHLEELARREREDELNALERDFRAASSGRKRFLGRRRLVVTVTVMVALLGLALAAGYFGNRAATERDRARTQLATATSVSLAGDSNDQLKSQPDVSLLLSLAAVEERETPQARASMISALEAARRSGAQTILRTHHGLVGSVAFSPDGSVLASAGSNGTVALWNTKTWSRLSLDGHQDDVNGVAFSPDGKTLASAGGTFTGRNGTVVLWDAKTGSERGTPLKTNQRAVLAVAFSPDGKTLASAGVDGTVELWDTSTWRRTGKTLKGPPGPVDALAFSPDGKTLASSGNDGTVELWDPRTGGALGEPLDGRQASVNGVAFSPDGKTLASAGGASGVLKGTVVLWDTRTRREVGRLVDAGQAFPNGVAFSPDGKTLASGGDNFDPGTGTVELWNTESRSPIGKPLAGDQDSVLAVAFSPDGKTLAAAGEDGTVVLWSTANRSTLGQSLNGSQFGIFGLAFSPDGRTLASGGGYEATVEVWNTRNGRTIGKPLSADQERLNELAFSPDGKTLATAGDDGTVVRWDTATWRRLGDPLVGHQGPVNDVAFSPDGKTLATADGDFTGDVGTVVLWDAKTGRMIGRPFDAHEGPVLSVAFSPDGKTLASGGNNGAVALWDPSAGRKIGKSLSVPQRQAVTDLAFSPDGKMLASGGGGSVVLWDTKTWRMIGQPLDVGTGRVAVAFSPDGRVLAAGGDDWTVSLWDTATGSRLGVPLNAKQGAVEAVAFSPDGRTLATGGLSSEEDGGSGTVVLWKGILWNGDDPGYLKGIVCGLVHGNLTGAEWQTLAPGLPYLTTC